jgi:hypothetical protein
MHPSLRECCSQNGCKAQVPVQKAAHSSVPQEQNISDLEHLLGVFENKVLMRIFLTFDKSSKWGIEKIK